MTENYRIEMVNEAFRYNLNTFSCGEESLDTFVRQYLLRQHQRNIIRGYVLITDDEIPRIVGYYTLSGSCFERGYLPSKSQQKKIPYFNAPSVTLGRLAIDVSLQGKGYGSVLVAHAMKVVSKASDAVGIYGMFVEALNDGAKEFYRKLGFIELNSPNENSLFFSTPAIKKIYP